MNEKETLPTKQEVVDALRKILSSVSREDLELGVITGITADRDLLRSSNDEVKKVAVTIAMTILFTNLNPAKPTEEVNNAQ